MGSLDHLISVMILGSICSCIVGNGTLEGDVCESPDVVEFEGVGMDGGFWLSTLRGAADVNTASKRTKSVVV